jgi:AsmA protein
LATLSAKGNFKAAELRSKALDLDNIIMDFNVQDGAYKINSNQVRFFGKNAKGKSYVELSPFSNDPSYHINYIVNKFYAEEMLVTFLLDTTVTGPLSLSMDVNSKGADWNTIVKNIKGSINLSGKDLILYGMDADKLIEKFKRSQSFNLVDLGAVLLAGPVGIAVTKGSDYASILIANPGESSQITNMVSNWKIANGAVTIQDAAFTTHVNRIAAKGLIDFSQDSLNLTIALLNKNGCSIFSQDINGNLNSPTLGRLKVVGTILSPVTNLVDDIFGIDCDVFYDGTVKHPIKK